MSHPDYPSWAAPFNFPPRPDSAPRGGVDAVDHARMKETHAAARTAHSDAEIQALIDARVAEVRIEMQAQLDEWYSRREYDHAMGYANNVYEAGVRAREMDEEGEIARAAGWRGFAVGGALAVFAVGGAVILWKFL